METCCEIEAKRQNPVVCGHLRGGAAILSLVVMLSFANVTRHLVQDFPVCVFFRILDSPSSPLTRTTGRTSQPQMTPEPPRWEPSEPSSIWSYVLSSLSLLSTFCNSQNLVFGSYLPFVFLFQTNETKDVVCLIIRFFGISNYSINGVVFIWRALSLFFFFFLPSSAAHLTAT